MAIKIIDSPISKAELQQVAQETFGDMLKAVVDIKRGMMAIGGEMHADMEAGLLQNGSQQGDVWGINLYPDQQGDDWLEFNSMINIRPRQGNSSRGVENPDIQRKIRSVVASIVAD